MIKYITFLSVLFLTSMASWAVQPYQPAQPNPVLESWRWHSFPELKGLGLECMAEDDDGNLWFGVNDGVRIVRWRHLGQLIQSRVTLWVGWRAFV